MTRIISVKAVKQLTDTIDGLCNRFEAVQKQVATLHIQGAGTPLGAYQVGQAQLLAQDIKRDLDRLSNAIYQLALITEQQQNERDRTTAEEAKVARASRPAPAQATQNQTARPHLDASRPGAGHVRDQLATEAVDQPRPHHPLV